MNRLPDIQHGSEIITPHGCLLLSPIAERMQNIGKSIIDNGSLLEVEPGVLSTCSDPIESLGDRLLRARDKGIPLVEISLNPGHTDSKLVPIVMESGIIHSILRSEGIEARDRLHGNHMPYERLAMSLSVARPKQGHKGYAVGTCLDVGRYHGYDETQDPDFWADDPDFWYVKNRSTGPSFGAHCYHDHEYAWNWITTESQKIHLMLDNVIQEFETAEMREGSIEGTAEEISPYELPSGEA